MINFIKYIFLFLITWSSSVQTAPNIDIKTGILMDYHTDKVLYELEPDMSIYPASMTKIMTAIVAFDLLKSKKISLDDKITISQKGPKTDIDNDIYANCFFFFAEVNVR